MRSLHRTPQVAPGMEVSYVVRFKPDARQDAGLPGLRAAFRFKS